MGRIIGIDLGTTNSVAAYWKRRQPKSIMQDGSPLTPSVICLEQGMRIVGEKAKERRYSGSENVIYSVKRFIGRDFDDEKTQEALGKNLSYQVRKAKNGEVEIKLGEAYYSPVEISAMILEKLKKDAEQELGEEVTHAVVTVPAYFSQRQKNATREAGKLAGLNVLRIINEPTAAALAFGVEEAISEPEHILVYDLGGGTFDVSILMISPGNLEVLRVDGDNFLGGDDFDSLIMDEMLQQLQRQSGESFSENIGVKNIIKGQAEQLKIALSREEQSRAVAPGIAQTRRGSPVNFDFSLTRAQFEKMITPLIEHSFEIVNRALRQERLSVEEINRVLLVGGSTRIPLVRRRLKELFGDKIQIDVDPMQCVALGAAIQTSLPIEWQCPVCNSMNEGEEEVCRSCHTQREQAEDFPVILCDACGKPNRQGRLDCWSCGALIGAVMQEGDGESGEPAAAIHIGDVTSKYLGIEALQHGGGIKESELKVIIPKGTPYPTFEPCIETFYTNYTGQEILEFPVYEVEREGLPKEKWEQVGTVINDKIPPGTPVDTPVIVEMRIDGDNILYIGSYLKRMKEETLVAKSFHFGRSADASNAGMTNELEELDTLSFILEKISSVGVISKYLTPDCKQRTAQVAQEARSLVDANDESHASAMVEQVNKQIAELPTPTWQLFFAYWCINQAQTTQAERNKMTGLINQMESALAIGDVDQANRYLNQIKLATNVLLEKIPSNLLKGMRG